MFETSLLNSLANVLMPFRETLETYLGSPAYSGSPNLKKVGLVTKRSTIGEHRVHRLGDEVRTVVIILGDV